MKILSKVGIHKGLRMKDKLSFEIKEDLDFENNKDVYNMMSSWVTQIDNHGSNNHLSSRGIGDTMHIKEIKAKSKWYHKLVPNFIWNKFMIVQTTKLVDVILTGVDFGTGNSETIECTLNYNYITSQEDK